jgi:membrane protease YdiL (CAAX protease family)
MATAAGVLESSVGLGADTRTDTRTASRRRDVIELAIGWALIMAVIWMPKPFQRWMYWAPVVFILAVGWLRFESWSAMGLRARNLLRSSWIVGLALSLSAIASVIAMRFGTLHVPPSIGQFFLTYIGYTVWSFVQQFLLLSFFLARLLRLMPGKYSAALVAASLFALAHLPNPILTPMTMVWGIVSCLMFLKYRNVWTLGMAHAILGVTVAITLPGYVTHNMRVGLGYLRYHQPHAGHRRNSDQIVSTDACVIADAATRRC